MVNAKPPPPFAMTEAQKLSCRKNQGKEDKKQEKAATQRGSDNVNEAETGGAATDRQQRDKEQLEQDGNQTGEEVCSIRDGTELALEKGAGTVLAWLQIMVFISAKRG